MNNKHIFNDACSFLFTNLASIFLTFSVTRAIVSSVFSGQVDIEDGLLTSDNEEAEYC